MKLAILTTLAFPAVSSAAGVTSLSKAIHELFGAEQLAEVEAHCDGCQPDYCYPEFEEPNFQCYKDGYPKCCTKNKGNCPNNNKPDCECSGDCHPSCTYKGPGNWNGCSGNEICAIGLGDCMLRVAEQDGVCYTPSGTCTMEYFPVCGCDNDTYANSCSAYAAGVNIQYAGVC